MQLQHSDLSNMTSAQQANAYKALLTELNRPFDLADEPLCRIHMIRFGAQEFSLALCMHHIISDGWSVEIFINDFINLYEAFQAGQPNPLPPLPIQYADYALWQRHS